MSVREPGLGARRLVSEGERQDWCVDSRWEAVIVFGRLQFNLGKGLPFWFGLDCANGPAVDKQKIVGPPMWRTEDELSDSHSLPGTKVDLVRLLHDPT